MSATEILSLPLDPPREDEYRPFPDEQGRNRRQEWLEIPAMIHLLSLPRGGAVLEIGCGRGVALPVLWRLLRPKRLAGADIDPALLEVASARLSEQDVPAQLNLADVRSLPFPDRAFDLCIDFGTLFHIARPELALSELIRVLRPGGVLVTETRLSQLLSHPIRSQGRRIPWSAARRLEPVRHAGLWRTHRVSG